MRASNGLRPRDCSLLGGAEEKEVRLLERGTGRFPRGGLASFGTSATFQRGTTPSRTTHASGDTVSYRTRYREHA
jgi:hypothetical protein